MPSIINQLQGAILQPLAYKECPVCAGRIDPRELALLQHCPRCGATQSSWRQAGE